MFDNFDAQIQPKSNFFVKTKLAYKTQCKNTFFRQNESVLLKVTPFDDFFREIDDISFSGMASKFGFNFFPREKIDANF